jgi:hypothetical protein
MPVKPLPPNPDLDHLKNQARDLLKLHAARDLASAQRIREFHPRFAGKKDGEIFAASLKLSDAQLTIARERGFASWTRLKEQILKPSSANNPHLHYHDRIQDPALRQAVLLLDAGDLDGLRGHLKAHPDLPRQHAHFEGGNYFRTPTLLEFIAENPIRNGTLPANIVEIAKAIIIAGAEQAAMNETLGLVSTGRIVRECGAQIPLIDLLCDHGADPDTALRPAAGHGEHEAVGALIRRGARLDLPVAAALGRDEDVRRLLPSADLEERHCALAMGAQFGNVEVVRMLLDAGEDPNRYNPPGAHSHSTPLHQAALAGHQSVVRLLIERGARLDMRDVLWKGTPADWAHHAERFQLEEWMRARELTRDPRD